MNYAAIEAYAKRIASSFNDPLLSRKSKYKSVHPDINIISSIQRIGLYQYIEHIGFWALSNNTMKNVMTSPYYNIVYFIQQCFPFDSIIDLAVDEEEYTDSKIKIGT